MELANYGFFKFGFWNENIIFVLENVYSYVCGKVSDIDIKFNTTMDLLTKKITIQMPNP